jgi:DNA-binding IclR family transcriptional regulator
MEHKIPNDISPSNEVRALTRGLQIIEILSKTPEGLPLSEISKEANLSKSSTHRLLNTLKVNGFAFQDNKERVYYPSMKLLELSSTLMQRTNISDVARQNMEPLAELTRETIHFVIRDHDSVVYIEKVESPNTIRMYSSIGKRAPLHCTGVGKAILAFLPEDQIESIVREKPLKEYTQTTITDPEKLLTNLEEIRIRGYALDDAEHEENICCVAAPLFTRTGKVVGAISISAVSFRANLEKVESWAPMLLQHTKQLNTKLEYYFDRYE